MINKSDSRCAVVRFCHHSYDYRLNWTPLSLIAITYCILFLNVLRACWIRDDYTGMINEMFTVFNSENASIDLDPSLLEESDEDVDFLCQ